MDQPEALPPHIAELPAVERFIALIDMLCAAILAEMAPKTWWGALFCRFSNPLMAQACDALRGIGDRLRALAADVAAGVAREPSARSARPDRDEAGHGDGADGVPPRALSEPGVAGPRIVVAQSGRMPGAGPREPELPEPEMPEPELPEPELPEPELLERELPEPEPAVGMCLTGDTLNRRHHRPALPAHRDTRELRIDAVPRPACLLAAASQRRGWRDGRCRRARVEASCRRLSILLRYGN